MNKNKNSELGIYNTVFFLVFVFTPQNNQLNKITLRCIWVYFELAMQTTHSSLGNSVSRALLWYQKGYEFEPLTS